MELLSGLADLNIDNLMSEMGVNCSQDQKVCIAISYLVCGGFIDPTILDEEFNCEEFIREVSSLLNTHSRLGR